MKKLISLPSLTIKVKRNIRPYRSVSRIFYGSTRDDNRMYQQLIPCWRANSRHALDIKIYAAHTKNRKVGNWASFYALLCIIINGKYVLYITLCAIKIKNPNNLKRKSYLCKLCLNRWLYTNTIEGNKYNCHEYISLHLNIFLFYSELSRIANQFF